MFTLQISFKPLLLKKEGAAKSVSRGDCEQQGGKLLRPLYQLRPIIRPQVRIWRGQQDEIHLVHKTEPSTECSTPCFHLVFLGRIQCHGLINYNRDNKAKCRHLKKLTCKGTVQHVFICPRKRVKIELLYRPARLHKLAKWILGLLKSLKVRAQIPKLG